VLSQLGTAERGQLQPLHPRQPDQLGQQRAQRMAAVQLIRPVADHQHHPTRPQGAGQEGDQVTGRAVSPMQVLQQHHHRRALSTAHQQGTHGVKHLQLVKTLACLCDCRSGVLDPAQQPADGGRGRGDLGQQLRVGGIVGKAAQGVHHREVGKADVAQLHTAAGKHPRPALLGLIGELGQQPGLAHPGITGQQHDLRAAVLSPVQRPLDSAQLSSPTNERLRCKPARHARQYGRGQRRWKRAGSLHRPAPCCGCHLRAHRPQHQLPPATRGLLASPTRRASATHHTLMGGLPLTFGDVLLGEHAGQSGMLVVHLALPSAVCLRAGR
jgi:hypothetical protein